MNLFKKSSFHILTYTFIFNIIVVIIFSLIYSSMHNHNFIDSFTNTNNKNISYIDYLFYSLTIQSGVGLPDISAVSDIAKILAMIQQFILMGSTYIIFVLFLKK